MTCGVPQDSVLGSTLWNIYYDGLLRQRLPDGVRLIRFAYAIGIFAINYTSEGLKKITNNVLQTMDDWIGAHGLQLAHTKTEAIMLTAKWAYKQAELHIGGVPIQMKRVVRYLGVMLDSKLTFTHHIRAVSTATTASARAIVRLMPNVGGPSAAK